ncbi:hypothetical protein WJX73_005136 [Symbiochloris irregularis]|uniref:Uncharacterized protein n=1 Tax=Symbiochloris irregularis TaxID=706552 RepID=A0AAW1PSS3_9CHLO
MLRFGPILSTRMTLFSIAKLPSGLAASGAETVKEGVDHDDAQGVAKMTAAMVAQIAGGLVTQGHTELTDIAKQAMGWGPSNDQQSHNQDGQDDTVLGSLQQAGRKAVESVSGQHPKSDDHTADAHLSEDRQAQPGWMETIQKKSQGDLAAVSGSQQEGKGQQWESEQARLEREGAEMQGEDSVSEDAQKAGQGVVDTGKDYMAGQGRGIISLRVLSSATTNTRRRPAKMAARTLTVCLLAALVLSSEAQVFGAKRSMLDDIAQAPVSAVEAATAAGPSSDEPVADVTAGTCTPSFPDATPTNFSSCYCSCPTEFSTVNSSSLSALSNLTVTLPEATFSYSGPDPLFTGGENPIEAVASGDAGVSVGGRRLLATEPKYSLPADVLPLLSGVLQGGQISGRAIPQWLVNDVLLGLGIAPRITSLPTDLLTGLEIENAADSLTQGRGLPTPPQPTSSEVTDAVRVILAVSGVRVLTDPNTLPTIIADAITLVKDPKAAIAEVPSDLLSAVKTILNLPFNTVNTVITDLESFLSKLDFPGLPKPSLPNVPKPSLPGADVLVEGAVEKLIDTIKNKPNPFINLIEAGLSETLVNALKYGIPANETIFGSAFSGIPAIPQPILSALEIALSGKVKLATLQSADTLAQDFFSSVKSNGPSAVVNKGPITPSELFSALQIFDALAVDQNLPFDFINAIQVFLNVTVPEPLAKLAETPRGLFPALPQQLVGQLQNLLGDGTVGFDLPSSTLPDLSNLNQLANILSGLLPSGLANTSLGAGLEQFLNTTVGVPVQFVANVTERLFPAPPPNFPGIPFFPASTASNTSTDAGLGPLGLPLPNSPIPTGTAGKLSVFDPLPVGLVNTVQDLMLPGTLPTDTDLPLPPVVDSIRSLLNYISPGAIANYTRTVEADLFSPGCQNGAEQSLSGCFCTCALES